jgi:AcrR family transcriptional regulator
LTETPARRRGRPPKSSVPAEAPADRLVAAAGEACAQLGFERVTLEAIGQRVGMTPAAIYNHFSSKDELLYAAGLHGLERLTATLAGSELAVQTVHDIAAAYLRPEMASTRRLFLELHLAGTRHPELALHLARWHAQWAKVFADLVDRADEDPGATVKALFLVLLGLCHIDQLGAMPADGNAIAQRVDRLVGALYPDGGR